MGDTGFEAGGGAREKRVVSKSDAQSDARAPQLSEIVAGWPTLPEPVRAGILAMVRAAKGGA
jgi:hypothetical protein